MKTSTNPDHHALLHLSKVWLVLLSLLVVGTICLGRQSSSGQTASPTLARRTLPASRLKVIQLPEPSASSAVSFEQALTEQQNMELPGSQRLEMPKVGQLVWATQGVRLARTTAPAGRAQATATTNPVRVYVLLPDGIYLYNSTDHSLQQTSDTDVRGSMAAALLNQPGAPIGGCQIIIAGSSRDFGARYGSRARTIMLLHAGRISQNIQLQAVALGLTFIGADGLDTTSVRRVARLARGVEPIYAAIIGYPASLVPETPAAQPTTADVGKTTALIILPSQGFQDEEYMATRRQLELAGVQVSVAGMRMGMLTGMLGGSVRADMLLNQANINDYNAVIFIGGVGAVEYYNNRIALKLAQQAAAQGKILAAIGTAPSILANAGTLKGVRSTAYLSEQARMVQGGAVYTGNAVEKDGSIVTATGRLAVSTFAQAVLDALAEVR